MSTTSNAAQGTGTSNEVATTPMLPDITLGEPLELEASDPASASSLSSHPPSRSDATEVALGVKWGLADYGRFMEGRSGQRITRNTAQAVWSGESASAAQVGTYRGHRVPRALHSTAPAQEPGRQDASQVGGDPETQSRLPDETRPESASDCEDEHCDGSLLEDMDERCEGRLLEIERREGHHLAELDKHHDGSLPDKTAQHCEGCTRDTVLSESPHVEIGTWRHGDRTVVHTYLDPRLIDYM
ncbi:hypothetical protein V8D89_002275 [Ganoderma adspersum]